MRGCEKCGGSGYRPDFVFLDHHGQDTPATKACEAGVRPCPYHECYWAQDNHQGQSVADPP